MSTYIIFGSNHKHKDPVVRKERFEKTRLNLQVEILRLLDEISILTHEIEMCNKEIDSNI